jgi:hypothetical protein
MTTKTQYSETDRMPFSEPNVLSGADATICLQAFGKMAARLADRSINPHLTPSERGFAARRAALCETISASFAALGEVEISEQLDPTVSWIDVQWVSAARLPRSDIPLNSVSAWDTVCIMIKPKKTQNAAKTPAKATLTSTLHLRLARETVEKLDALAKANGTTRAAVLQIAVARILRTGSDGLWS